MIKKLKTTHTNKMKTYFIEYYTPNKTNEIKIMTLPIITSKINFAFLYFFERKKLNKITVINSKTKNISTNISSPASQSTNVPPRIIKINNIFSKANNTFNAIKEYLINITTTYYRKEK